ncbi:hypothetical protein FGO68_gene2927 [Halteria grandinella]|uniref:Uncharacterized protein n=1 Tax=Halteria grandinella TaxID=5974 RepID=A0A8J8NDT3_HALGN|nr:hypothetical protein FGO68_gene2927 [Halteria grandinella]
MPCFEKQNLPTLASLASYKSCWGDTYSNKSCRQDQSNQCTRMEIFPSLKCQLSLRSRARDKTFQSHRAVILYCA